MGLKTPGQYIESLRDGRVTYWDGERIDDITKHPRFDVPIAMTAKDYELRLARIRQIAAISRRGRQRSPPHLRDSA